MELKTLRETVEGGVATITLNRPHCMNAWTGGMHMECRWALAQAEEDPCMIGLTRANELFLSRRVFLAEEALSLGLVNAVLRPEELLSYTYKYARNLVATVSPGSLRETKRQIYADLHRDVREAVESSKRLVERMATEPDFAEGVAAFTEKRLPRWAGKP